MVRPPYPRTVARWGLFVTVCLITAGFRFLTLGDGFPNDHFVYITGGWQMLAGEWPTRDWVDPGLPLMFTASAAAQAAFGRTLLAEAILVSAAFGVAAALTSATVVEMTASLWLAAAAAVLEVIVFPRTYGYPKVLVYALAFLAFARFVTKPSAWRITVMALAVVVAFLFRHDHGLFLGVGGLLTILCTDPGSWRLRARHAATFAGAILVFVLPYLIYVQWYLGVGPYLRAGLEFSRREATRQWHVWPAVFGDPEPLSSALVYQFHVLPLVALAVLFALRRHPRAPVFAAQVIPVASVAVMVNYSFIRDPLLTRLPDPVVPALVLGAWLVMRAVEARARGVMMSLAAVAAIVFAASIASAGDIAGNVNRSDLRADWDHLPRLFGDRSASLTDRFSVEQVPTRATLALRPFMAYLARCTTFEHRLLVGGFLVELPFYAQRRFAAGQAYFGGSFGGDEGEALALRRLDGQAVPFAILPSDYANDFETGFSRVSAYVSSRYQELVVVPVDDELDVRILVNAGMVPSGVDAETGWPCFLP